MLNPFKKKESPVEAEQVSPAFSPVIEDRSDPNLNKIKMTFPEAMKKVIEGSKITRIYWKSAREFGLLRDNTLQIHTAKDNQFHYWVISDGDMKAEDYIEL